MPRRMSTIVEAAPQLIASATLHVDTPGAGFTDITENAVSFVTQAGAGEGVLLIYLRHTSASLTIQENADPDVQADLVAALDRLAPEDAPWIHDVEGPDDMPAHVKAMLNGVSLQVPVIAGKLALGTWQGIYLVEHRRRPHSREIIFQFVGSRNIGIVVFCKKTPCHGGRALLKGTCGTEVPHVVVFARLWQWRPLSRCLCAGSPASQSAEHKAHSGHRRSDRSGLARCCRLR